MARPLRVDLPDGVYHVTSRGLERREIVGEDRDRRRWVELLGEVAERRQWRVLAWALMGNHFHLFLRTPQADLSAGMHDLNSGYVNWFNRKHRRFGPLFQGRFKGILVERNFHYWELSRYVHLNPVRACLADRPEAYPWSSCAAYFDAKLAPDWLAWEEALCEHGRTLRAARREYARFLWAGLERPPTSPLRDAVASTVLGRPEFVERVRDWLAGRRPDPAVPAVRSLQRSLSVDEVLGGVSRAWGVPVERLLVRGARGGPARAVAAYLCRRLTREPLASLGLRFGGISAQAVSNLVSQVARAAQGDRNLAAQLAELEAALKPEARM